MFNYTCRFKAWCFATGRKSTELFRMYKYLLNQIETTGSKYDFIISQWPGSAPYASVHICYTLNIFSCLLTACHNNTRDYYCAEKWRKEQITSCKKRACKRLSVKGMVMMAPTTLMQFWHKKKYVQKKLFRNGVSMLVVLCWPPSLNQKTHTWPDSSYSVCTPLFVFCLLEQVSVL